MREAPRRTSCLRRPFARAACTAARAARAAAAQTPPVATGSEAPRLLDAMCADGAALAAHAEVGGWQVASIKLVEESGEHALEDAQKRCRPSDYVYPWQPDCGDQYGFDFGAMVELHGLILGIDARIDRWPDTRPRKLQIWAGPTLASLEDHGDACTDRSVCTPVDLACHDDALLASTARFVFARPVRTRFLAIKILAGWPRKRRGTQAKPHVPFYVMARTVAFH